MSKCSLHTFQGSEIETTESRLSDGYLQFLMNLIHGPLARYAKLRVRMRRECRERFPRHRR